MSHPRKDVLVGTVLLRAITGEEVSEGVHLVLLWVLETTVAAQSLQIFEEGVGVHLAAVGHENDKL